MYLWHYIMWRTARCRKLPFYCVWKLYSSAYCIVTIMLSLTSKVLQSSMFYCCEELYCSAKDTNCSTRLETRTKEFNSSASRSVPTKHDRRSESNFVWEIFFPPLCVKFCIPGRLGTSRLIYFKRLGFCGRAIEHLCWDPKDGELCSSMVKPGEILVEACVVRNWRANRYRLTRV